MYLCLPPHATLPYVGACASLDQLITCHSLKIIDDAGGPVPMVRESASAFSIKSETLHAIEKRAHHMAK